MVIYAKKIAVAADTAAQGELLFKELLAAFAKNERVTLSFDGVDTATSSFVNTALVPLLDMMTFDDIKKRLKVICSTRQINDMIKRRLSREAELLTA